MLWWKHLWKKIFSTYLSVKQMRQLPGKYVHQEYLTNQ